MRFIKLINALEGNSYESRVRNTLQSLLKSNTDNYIVKLDVIINSNGPSSFDEEYNCVKETIVDIFKKKIPAFSIIYQPLCTNTEFTIQYQIYNKSTDVHYKNLLNHPYVTVKHEGGLEVFSGAISFKEDTLLFSAQRCFDFAEQILMAEDLDFGHIYRQWNYIPKINGSSAYDHKERKNINIFNEISNFFYEETLLINGKPVISNINNKNNTLLLDFNAFEENTDKKLSNFDLSELSPKLNIELIYNGSNECWFKSNSNTESLSLDIEHQTIQILKSISALKDICKADMDIDKQFNYIKVTISKSEDCTRVEELITGLLPNVEIFMVKSESNHSNALVEVEGIISF